MEQCPTCGRIGIDWAGDSTKYKSDKLNKVNQRKDVQDRTAEYRKWRWCFGDGKYVNDVDHVEWRMVDGKPKAVAVFELSRVDGNVHVPDKYLDAVLSRYNKRDGQSAFIKYTAQAFNTHAWIVLFRWDLSEFWVYNLTNNSGWYKNLTKDQYEDWIRRLT
jgi:hypothetical protein